MLQLSQIADLQYVIISSGYKLHKLEIVCKNACKNVSKNIAAIAILVTLKSIRRREALPYTFGISYLNRLIPHLEQA